MMHTPDQLEQGSETWIHADFLIIHCRMCRAIARMKSGGTQLPTCRIPSSNSPANVKPSGNDPNRDPRDTKSLRSQVKIFLNAWLIDQRIDDAVEHFDTIAFSNPKIFSASCIGDIEDRKNAIDRRIRNFLKEFVPQSKPKAIREILVLDNKILEANKHPTNSPNRDGFYLFSLTEADRNSPQSDAEFDYVSAHVDLSQCAFCVSGIRFSRDGVTYLYTIWHKTGKSWKIVHANLFCP